MTIDAPGGGTFSMHLALPARTPAPAVVVVHEIMGVNDHIRAVCDRFAAEGYAAAAPDLLWRVEPGIELGYTEKDLDRAFEVYQQFDAERAVTDIAATVAVIRTAPWNLGAVGAVGFCLGGRLVFMAGMRGLVDCAVCYYGVGIDRELGSARAGDCPLLLHFGGADEYLPPGTVARIEAALRGRPRTGIHRYAQAGHGFNCDARESYHPESARLAWERTLAALRAGLAPGGT